MRGACLLALALSGNDRRHRPWPGNHQKAEPEKQQDQDRSPAAAPDGA